VEFYGGVGEERGFPGFTFGSVTDGEDEGGGVQGEELARGFEAHAGASAGEDDGFAAEVEVGREGHDFGLGEDALGAEEGCLVGSGGCGWEIR